MSDPYVNGIANDLLTALNYKEYPTEIRDFLFDTAYELEALMELQPNPCADYNDVLAGLEDLIACLRNRALPSDFFQYISHGYNKECYSFSPHFVIKFCAERNPTAREEKVLLDAFYEDVDEMFIPTRYIRLPIELPSNILEKEDEEEYDPETDSWYPIKDWEDNTTFDAVCFQPLVSNVCANDLCSFLPKEDWVAKSAAVGLPITEPPEVWNALGDAPIKWVAALINHFGFAQTRKLADFCYGFRIYDLHGANVGYMDGVPIILDWLSN